MSDDCNNDGRLVVLHMRKMVNANRFATLAKRCECTGEFPHMYMLVLYAKLARQTNRFEHQPLSGRSSSVIMRWFAIIDVGIGFITGDVVFESHNPLETTAHDDESNEDYTLGQSL